ncbi:hypothetical protein MAPG_10958 [Magnaporthiopsis poae ATCC 64411]|uniref:Uncharacterized protein n=1 Tax=Magnaporthiopsis poae (strain ATCC 64411 / 73-15) TaxID=644358 RepID=A0A0C4EDZ8_MAGP6|nr:hypothetical protein MAPG_10958 [Magnaporthiopsis poae ATCC 64411]
MSPHVATPSGRPSRYISSWSGAFRRLLSFRHFERGVGKLLFVRLREAKGLTWDGRLAADAAAERKSTADCQPSNRAVYVQRQIPGPLVFQCYPYLDLDLNDASQPGLGAGAAGRPLAACIEGRRGGSLLAGILGVVSVIYPNAPGKAAVALVIVCEIQAIENEVI